VSSCRRWTRCGVVGWGTPGVVSLVSVRQDVVDAHAAGREQAAFRRCQAEQNAGTWVDMSAATEAAENAERELMAAPAADYRRKQSEGRKLLSQATLTAGLVKVLAACGVSE